MLSECTDSAALQIGRGWTLSRLKLAAQLARIDADPGKSQ